MIHGFSTAMLPRTLAQSAVPVCLAPNGTVATNGIITLGTALPTTYSGGIWMRLPAGAVSGGAAGLYWAVMTSTTQGQVYTNFADPASEFIPRIPTGALVAAVGSNVAYTQTTGAAITLINTKLPGGALGDNGSMRKNVAFSYNLAAGSKQLHQALGGVNLVTSTRTTTGGSDSLTHRMRNRGSQTRNVFSSLSEAASTASSNSFLSINTAVDLSDVISAQIDIATNLVVVESVTIEVLPS